MQFFVRCLLWIMMAALPLQGGAAFAACKTQAPAATGHGCHEQDAAGGVRPQDDGGATMQAHGKCSTCASCCTAATAPPQSPAAPAPCPRAGRTLPVAEPAIAAIFPAGPERPPRPA